MKFFLAKSAASIFSTEPAWLGDIRTWIWAKNGSNKSFWKNSRTNQGPPIDSTKIPD